MGDVVLMLVAKVTLLMGLFLGWCGYHKDVAMRQAIIVFLPKEQPDIVGL